MERDGFDRGVKEHIRFLLIRELAHREHPLLDLCSVRRSMEQGVVRIFAIDCNSVARCSQMRPVRTIFHRPFRNGPVYFEDQFRGKTLFLVTSD